VLAGLAAGFTPDEVWSDLGAAILAEPVDTDDLDRVVLVHGPDELMNVFAYPFATWRVYLQPTLRAPSTPVMADRPELPVAPEPTTARPCRVPERVFVFRRTYVSPTFCDS